MYKNYVSTQTDQAEGKTSKTKLSRLSIHNKLPDPHPCYKIWTSWSRVDKIKSILWLHLAQENKIQLPYCHIELKLKRLRGNVKKKPSTFVDIVQIEVDLPLSYLIFDKFIFDILLIMLTSLPPLEFLTKIIKFQALKL